jgi:uncharacterized membrane protein
MRILKSIFKFLFAMLFLGAGISHFSNTNFFLRMVPPYLPYHLELVYISGVAEIALALLLLIPPTSGLAAWGIIALLIAVFPANIQMALHPETFPEFSLRSLQIRLAIQGLLIAWAYCYTQRRSKSTAR